MPLGKPTEGLEKVNGISVDISLNSGHLPTTRCEIGQPHSRKFRVLIAGFIQTENLLEGSMT
jgi:hypothetical protein